VLAICKALISYCELLIYDAMQGNARGKSWQITRKSPQKSRMAAAAGYFLDTGH
jgi:hypothetical protein